MEKQLLNRVPEVPAEEILKTGCRFYRIKFRIGVVLQLFMLSLLMISLLISASPSSGDTTAPTLKNTTPSAKKILVLHTFKSKRPWSLLFNRYFTEQLKKSNLTDYTLEIENLDLIEFNRDEYKEILRRELEFKYNDPAPDIIIATLNPVANFIIRNNLFPNTPKIFILPDISPFKGIPDTALIQISFDFRGGVEHALDLLPGTQKVVVISGNSPVDLQMADAFRSAVRNLPKRVEFEYITGLDVEATLNRAGKLAPNSIVFALAYTAAPGGKPVINQDFNRQLAIKCNRPVFSFLDMVTLDSGILGGKVGSTRSLAGSTVKIIEKVFQGIPIGSISVEPPSDDYIYDWGQLKKWDIDLKKIPSGSIIQNRTYTFFEMFKWQITGGILLLIVESLLVLFLVLTIKRRKAAEANLRESEMRFRTLFEQAAVGVAQIESATGKFIRTNRRYCDIVGYGVNEILQMRSEEITHPEDLPIEMDNLKRLVEGEINEFSISERYDHRSGKVVWVRLSVSPMWITGEEPRYHIAVVEDITRLKETRDELKHQTALMQAIIDNIPVLITLYDRKLDVVLVNREFEKVIGWSNEELKEKHILESCYPDPEYRAQAIEYMQKDSTEWKEFRVATKYGYEIESIWSNVRLDNNTQIGIGIDITEKKKIESRLHQTRKMESIGILAGGIAHDFNNMLAVIIGNASLGMMDLNENDELYNILSEINDGAKKAQTLTQQLLTFSKGGSPIRKLSDLNQLIRESALFITSGAKSKCRFELAPDLLSVEVDQGQINQVINNLVINADQAMPEGGTIMIRTQNINLRDGNELSLPAGQYVDIAFEDSGIGISEKHLKDIFDPFFTTKQKGSGLGLSIVYSIVTKHGGNISVNSVLDKGTVVHIVLPAIAGKQIEPEAGSALKLHGQGRILIMDDQEGVQKMLGRILNRMGYETVFALEGTSAVEMYRQSLGTGEEFNLVILDLTIPGGMGGVETISELIKINPDIKALVSSGYSNDPVMSNYADYGFCGVLPKPYTKNQIIEVFKTVF